MIQVNVAVPPNCPPNALIVALAPDGRQIQCNVPQGMEGIAGAVFVVEIPDDEDKNVEEIGLEEMSVWKSAGSNRVSRQQVLDFVHEHAHHAYNVAHCNCKHFVYDFLCYVLESKKYSSFREFSRDVESRYSTSSGHGNFAKFATRATMTVHYSQEESCKCWVFTEEGIRSCHAYPFQTTEAALTCASKWRCCWVLMLEDGQEIKHGGYGLAHQTCRRNGREWLAKKQRPAIATAPATPPALQVVRHGGGAAGGRGLLCFALGGGAARGHTLLPPYQKTTLE
jgi:hypothetical protein